MDRARDGRGRLAHLLPAKLFGLGDALGRLRAFLGKILDALHARSELLEIRRERRHRGNHRRIVLADFLHTEIHPELVFVLRAETILFHSWP